MAGLKVLVDMDSVIMDTLHGYNIRLATMFPEVKIIPYEEITDHNFHDLYPEQVRPKLDEVWKSPGFFLDLKPIPGALEALAEMAELNDVAICTRCFLDSPTCESEKKASVRRYMGRNWAKRLILVRDKTQIKGDMLIDDCYPQIGKYEKPEWEHIIYDQPWNQHVTGVRRMTWKNWKQVLHELVSD